MQIRTERLILKPWAPGDEHALVRQANDHSVWRWMRDLFPHPYTADDAAQWIEKVQALGQPAREFAIHFEGNPIGGIGLMPKSDVHRIGVELGYWIGADFRGRGIATEAVSKIVDYAFDTFEIDRIEAMVFDGNDASTRVLEKTDFCLEGRLRRNVLKDGQILDTWVYSRLRDREPDSSGPEEISTSL